MGWSSRVGKLAAPHVQRGLVERAPDLTSGFVRTALDRAIQGVGPLPGAEVAAEKLLTTHRGDVEKVVHDLIEQHVRFAGGQGFLTNLGGITTVAVTVPANIVGLALIQCRLVAAICHVRGYDVHDSRVRTAILAAILGEDDVAALIRRKKLPGSPMALATAPALNPASDPDLETSVAAAVSGELIARVAGKRAASVVSRRVPVVGGLVGLGADGFATWRIGRYADREFLPRSR